MQKSRLLTSIIMLASGHDLFYELLKLSLKNATHNVNKPYYALGERKVAL